MAGMHLSLSDLVTCPRCGPSYGLVLLPHAVASRRVSSGVLGCANCRERYRIEGGVADLRTGGSDGSAIGAGDPEAAVRAAGESGVRLGALLGLAGAAGPVLLAGPTLVEASSLSGVVEAVEVVHLSGAGGEAEEPGDGVSPILADAGLPFRTASMSGVALTGEYVAWLEEGLRVLRPGARLLVEPGAGLRGDAEAAGGQVVVTEGEVLVLRRPPGAPPAK